MLRTYPIRHVLYKRGPVVASDDLVSGASHAVMVSRLTVVVTLVQGELLFVLAQDHQAHVRLVGSHVIQATICQERK